jgi:DNA-binding NtrC family response regulator
MVHDNLDLSLDKVIYQHISYVLHVVCNGNKKAAARMLKVSRSTLYRKLEEMENYYK